MVRLYNQGTAPGGGFWQNVVVDSLIPYARWAVGGRTQRQASGRAALSAGARMRSGAPRSRCSPAPRTTRCAGPFRLACNAHSRCTPCTIHRTPCTIQPLGTPGQIGPARPGHSAHTYTLPHTHTRYTPAHTHALPHTPTRFRTRTHACAQLLAERAQPTACARTTRTRPGTGHTGAQCACAAGRTHTDMCGQSPSRFVRRTRLGEGGGSRERFGLP
jgi:hypothetical protein